MSDIVTEVAKAIEKADTDIHVSYQDLARAAIEAYEAAKRISVPTAYYFNGIPVSDLKKEQQEEYLAYMKKLAERL